MLMGWFSATSPGTLVKVEGSMNPVEYGEILEENLLQPARELKLGWRFGLQQDNNRKHVFKSTQKFCFNVLQ